VGTPSSPGRGGTRGGERADSGGAPVRDAPPFRRITPPSPSCAVAALAMAGFSRSDAGLIPARGRGVPGSPPRRRESRSPGSTAGVRRGVRVRAERRVRPTVLHVARHGDRPLPRALLQAATFAAVGGRGTIVGPVVAASSSCPLQDCPCPFRAGPPLRSDPAGHTCVLPGVSSGPRGPWLEARREGRGAAPDRRGRNPHRRDPRVTRCCRRKGSRNRSAPPVLSGSPCRSLRGSRWDCSFPNGSGKTTSSTFSRASSPRRRHGPVRRKEITRLPLDRPVPLGIARPSQIPHRPLPSRSRGGAASPSAFNAGKRKARRRDAERMRRDRPRISSPGRDCSRPAVRPCAQLSQGCLRRLEFAGRWRAGRSC